MGWSLRRIVSGSPVSAAAPPEGTSDRERLLPAGRLEAFSDAVFAIAITLLVLELHVPGEHESLVTGLVHEWPRYLGYFVSFAFIGGVWIAHSNMTRFIEAADSHLMRLNLLLLLFVSLRPFTTAIAATHLFRAFLAFDDHAHGPGLAERIAIVVFGLNLTLAALMVYLMMRHAARTPGVAAHDLAEEELQAFAKKPRAALMLQAGATVVGVFLPITAVVFYLAVAVASIIEPLRYIDIRRRRASQSGMQATATETERNQAE